ncbi:MAG: hypothetical protein H0X62_09215, partial [Bacteroidetes bacterium]|nr:hypothetical protein [Bacteroidota bacterium]
MDIVILTDGYPISGGELFFEDEILNTHHHFNRIFLLFKNQNHKGSESFIPNNCTVLAYDGQILLADKLKTIPLILKPFFLNEIYLTSKKLPFKHYLKAFKIMFMELVKAIKIKEKIIEIVDENQIQVDETIFYSYWHDYKALALALYKKEVPEIKCIARAHGWDVDFERHNPPYLPFKNLIVSQLDKTFTISEKGKKLLLSLLNPTFEGKIEVSKLGKINSRKPNILKNNNEFLVCSCSSLIPLKRIHLIIDILSELKNIKINWVHFGDGRIKKDLEKYAREHLNTIEY